jgi:ubiquinone/menaquinone biosynthesis C-methylase UbiE
VTDNKEIVKQQYGAHANGYVTSSVHARGESLKRLVELVQPEQDWRALDISTGGGHTALAFAPLVEQVVATDLTPEMLVAAEKFIREQGITNVEFELADAENLPFSDSEFDLVTNRIALHHYPDAPRAIREIARVLKPGGLIGFTDNTVPPNKQVAGYINHFEKLRDPSHNWCYPIERLQRYFEEAGLEVTHVEEAVKPMEFEAWADRMGCSDETKRELMRLLDNAPPEARDFFNPRIENDKLMFSIRESVFIVRKP